MKLTSSQAHKFTSLVVLVSVMALGCGESFPSSQHTASSFFDDLTRPIQGATDGVVLSIDAGVIEASQPNYSCLPLRTLGISRASCVKSVDSSCECVRPSLVRYTDESGTWEDALRLDFISDVMSTLPEQPTPISSRLSVIIKLKLGDSRTTVVRVNYVHAGLIESLPIELDLPHD